MGIKYRKLKRGVKAGFNQSIGFQADARIGVIQLGQALSIAAMFLVRWLVVSSIFFCVFKYADKVIEWVSR